MNPAREQKTQKNHFIPSRRLLLFEMLVLWLLPSLACNLPILATQPGDTGGADSRAAARETLAARLFAVTPRSTQEAEELPHVTLFAPLPTVLPELAVVTPGVPAATLEGDVFRYISQPGDTVAALALRFNVLPDQILDPALFPPQFLLPTGLVFSIPNTLDAVDFGAPLLPDAEVVYSPTTVGFSVQQYVQAAGGYLSTYRELVDGQTLTGAQIIQRVADETSINPRLLLAFLELRSGWVTGSAAAPQDTRYPIGFYAGEYSGLYKEITLVARQLTIGYYGWRTGQVTRLAFVDSGTRRINPTINAGTAALQYLFATLYKPVEWQAVLYDGGAFLNLYTQMFGDPWQRAAELGPLLPDGLSQPPLELPLPSGERWSFTGGPHAAWGVGSTWGGLDFAPSTSSRGCQVSTAWATASAPGMVIRSENGQVVLDLDGDGQEQTGWVLLYLHVAAQDRVGVGTYLNTNDRLGHPSCEGGFATGTHVHIARKYNGEWLAADGPVPFVLSGWQAVAGERAYVGKLVKGDQVVTAQPDGSHTSLIIR